MALNPNDEFISRVSESHERAFTRWLNGKLARVANPITDLLMELRDGIIFIALIELLSGHHITLGILGMEIDRFGFFKIQMTENMNTIFRWLHREGVPLGGIVAKDIVKRNLISKLRLMWTLNCHYLFKWRNNTSMSKENGGYNYQNPCISIKDKLFHWINGKLAGQIKITNLEQDWRDGRAIGALVNASSKNLCTNWANWKLEDGLENTKEGMRIAEERLNVARIFNPEDLVSCTLDEVSMILYLSQFVKENFGQEQRMDNFPGQISEMKIGKTGGNCSQRFNQQGGKSLIGIILRRNLILLRNRVCNFDAILARLIAENLLSWEEKANIENKTVFQTRHSQIDKLIEELERKDIQLNKFVEVLKSSGNNHVVANLTQGHYLRSNNYSVNEYQTNDISIKDVIGHGQFSTVLEGIIDGERVAVKSIKSLSIDPEKKILNEINILAQLKHTHIVPLLGISKGTAGTNLIFELMENGNVKDFVKYKCPENDRLLDISCDITLGMDYLHDMQIIHRDLAARNVLLDSNLRAKVADFSLSKILTIKNSKEAEIYYKSSSTTTFPVRWAAKENFPDRVTGNGKFSFSSDVWAFGVTLWEIWNKEETPYKHLENNEDVENAILNGNNPNSFEIPENIDPNILEIMGRIFDQNPHSRPSFCEIKAILLEMKLNKTFKY